MNFESIVIGQHALLVSSKHVSLVFEKLDPTPTIIFRSPDSKIVTLHM